ncbi:MAG TPA: hypothetical protein VHN77_10010 [Phycisphaerales bacterium]|nr:hypothetical protein [Phycisphaerales bacterium]
MASLECWYFVNTCACGYPGPAGGGTASTTCPECGKVGTTKRRLRLHAGRTAALAAVVLTPPLFYVGASVAGEFDRGKAYVDLLGLLSVVLAGIQAVIIAVYAFLLSAPRQGRWRGLAIALLAGSLSTTVGIALGVITLVLWFVIGMTLYAAGP